MSKLQIKHEQNLPLAAEQALRVVAEAKRIAFDVETTGVDWKRCSVVGYVITADDFNCYIPIRHGGGQNLVGGKPVEKAQREPHEKFHVHPWEKKLAVAMRKRKGLTVGHNLKFDIHMALNHGVRIGTNGPIECTQLSAAMINEFASYSLAKCCEREKVTAKLGDRLYEHLAKKFGGDAKPDQMANFWRLPGLDATAVDYAMGDGVSTLALSDAQATKIKDMGLGFIWKVEQELQWYVMLMERTGIKIDEEALHNAKVDLEKRIAEAEKALPKDLNPKSGKQVRQYLEEHGITEFELTDKGNASLGEKFLLKSEAGRAIVEVRQYKTLLSSFILPMIETHLWNGRVHTTLNQLRSDEHGVVSGRFSSSEPNLQQITRRNQKTGKIHRSIFIPDEGKTLYEADYSQCEPRLFGHYSEDPTIVAGYNANPPIDLHSNTARLLGVERDPTAKRMGMGILTGMFPNTLAGHMDWDILKARQMYNDFMRAFPGLRQFQSDAKEVMLQRGYVKTILGRVCHMDDPRYAYRAVSRIIQGSNADILKYKMLCVFKMLEETKYHETDMLLTVHDSILFQSPDGDKQAMKDIIAIMADVMSEPINLIVPFKMDVKSGKSWAEATFGKDK